MDCRFVKSEDGTLWIGVGCKHSEPVRTGQEKPPRRNCVDTGRCRFFGDKLGTQECQGCQGTVKIKVFACALHGETTLGKPLDGIACCAQCGDYQPSKRDADADDGRSG